MASPPPTTGWETLQVRERAAAPCRGGADFAGFHPTIIKPISFKYNLCVLSEFRTSEMNAHVAASGAGRASMIHLGLGLKCPPVFRN